MDHYDEVEQARQKRDRKKKKKKVLIRLGILCAVLLVIAAIGAANGWFENTWDRIYALINPGSGFPVQIQDGELKQMDAVDANLAVLTDTNLYVYNASATEKLNVQHSCLNPVLCTAGARILVIDRGGSRAALYTANNTLNTWKTDGVIYTAALSIKGDVALVTGTENYISKTTVYNNQYHERFAIYSSGRYTVDLSLSDNAKYLAIGGIATEDGILCSTLSVYDTASDQDAPVWEYDMEDEMILHLQYLGNRDIMVITDKQAFVCGEDGAKKGSYAYGGGALQQFSYDQADHTALLLKYNEGSSTERDSLIVLDETARVTGSADLSMDVRAMRCKNDQVFLLSGNRLYRYDYTMRLQSGAEITQAWAFVPTQSAAYYATHTEIYQKEL